MFPGVMPLEVNLLSQLKALAAKYDAQGSPPTSPTKLSMATRLVHPKTKVREGSERREWNWRERGFSQVR